MRQNVLGFNSAAGSELLAQFGLQEKMRLIDQ